jgi:MoaA/NifB/PqqE/SkfB family radical SAM enzyme
MAGQKMFLYDTALPRVINISFNEKTCMFSCRMCPYHEPDVRERYKAKSEMDFETLKNLVASIPNDPVYSFDISAIGETLQFPRLAEYIAYMKKEKPLVNTIISTNGALLTPEIFRSLIESGLDNIQFSLFAQNAEDHKMITGSNSFERVCHNIREARRVRDEMGSSTPFMQTFIMECEETKEKVRTFIDEWSQYVDAAFARPLYNVGRTIEGMTPTFEQPVPEQRYPCIMPWYSTAIRSNGDVLHCYIYHWHASTKDKKIGNINDAPLKVLWNQPEFLEFRRKHRRMELENYPVCQSCNGWAAYTNVWEKGPDGFEYSGVSMTDLFRAAPNHRGG